MGTAMDWPSRHGRGARFGGLVVAATTFAFTVLAASAAAVDTVYWADSGGNAIRYAPADGSAPPAVLYGPQDYTKGNC